MAYQVLARKWRPQRFDDVIGQRGVTQTLRNAITAQRIAQSFVFAGPRGVGKTTTARILARALNCDRGPTPDPCGECDACREIAAGRDIDVIEIDAATNTQVDKVRAVIIEGLGMAPVRDHYKIFIIDEVHRLSNNAFDALLKSVEEPPPHVVFMMATTEIDKVPATIQSRSQVFELKTIGVREIAAQLQNIADQEGIAITPDAVLLLARSGDGSMRDAQSAFDQVIAFSSASITADDVSTVLGLVGRPLLIDMAGAVVRDDAGAAFALVEQSVAAGYEPRSVVRELGRLTRDLLVISVDPGRAADPEIASESERQALTDLARSFSREDLMRGFDVLTKAEYDIRGSAQPRYHLELALLRWIHMRRLVPLNDLIQQLEGGAADAKPIKPAAAPPRAPVVRPASLTPPTRTPAAAPAPPRATAAPAATKPPARERSEAAQVTTDATPAPSSAAPLRAVDPADLKQAFLDEVHRSKKFFHGTVVAQAQSIEVQAQRIVFVFGPHHKALRSQFEQMRGWLEPTATQLAGHPMAVVSMEGSAPTKADAGDAGAAGDAAADRRQALKDRAMAEPGVQALLDVFGGEIKDVEEM